MRIGLFTDTYPPYINGVSTSILMLKEALEKQGHIVYVVTINTENMQYKYEEKNMVIRVPGLPLGIYDYRLSTIYPLRIINKIKKWNLDIIHSHTEFGVGTFARIISKQFKIPLVHTYHTMYEDYVYYITKGYFDSASKKLVEYITRFYCDKTITELIVPTKKTYDLFKKKYEIERNVHIVPTGINLERFNNLNSIVNVNKLKKNIKLNKEDFVILFIGRIAKEKNITFLLENHKDIVKIHKNYKLVLVGDGPDIDTYKEYVRKNKLEENIIFVGKVPLEDVPSYYKIADIFVTASKTETQGLTVIEAMASSLAVVCIKDESFENVVLNNFNGFIFKNKKEYKNIVNKLASDSIFRKKVALQAKTSSKEFSSDYYASKVLDVYKEAIEKNKNKSKLASTIVNLFKKEEI